MTVNENLPICLKVEASAKELFPKIDAVASKLEAKLNFIAMSAGWFGDPTEEINWQFEIDCRSVDQIKLNFSDPVEQLADDVFISFDASAKKYLCFLQLTTHEIDLSLTKSAILPVLLEKKVTKILNTVAKRHQLPPLR